MGEQKYHKGDLVRIAKDLGPCKTYFTADCDAIVLYSYAEKYGGSGTNSYCLYIKEQGETSWYDEEDFALIQGNQLRVLRKWKEDEKKDRKEKSNLNWIFKHGGLILEERFGASIESLAHCLGVTNLWGSRGEGIDYAMNALKILVVAEPFLSTGDKEGWLRLCQDFKERKSHD